MSALTIVHTAKQGTKEWLELREKFHGASEASAMLGLSPYKKRNELLREKATGVAKDVDMHTALRFENGHKFEKLARARAEQILGEELYPATMSKGNLLCSLDGLTIDGLIIWEHKTLNDTIRHFAESNDISPHHKCQLEQQLYISGAEKCLFHATVWDENRLLEEVLIEYRSNPELLQQILNGWTVFDQDKANYAGEARQPIIGKVSASDLPIAVVQVRGELTQSNIASIKPHFDRFLLSARVNLETDEDFAVAEAEAKRAREAAKACKQVAKQVVSQISSISDVIQELEQYAAKFDSLALKQEKLVKTQKDAIKEKIILDAKTKFRTFIFEQEKSLENVRIIPSYHPDFISAVKSKRTIDSLRNSVDTELAHAQISLLDQVKLIKENLNVFNSLVPKDKRYLFPDFQTLMNGSNAKDTISYRMMQDEEIKQEHVIKPVVYNKNDGGEVTGVPELDELLIACRAKEISLCHALVKAYQFGMSQAESTVI